jgi:adenylate cyclase
VRVVEGAQECPAPAADELRTLKRIGAPESIRLACQLRPLGDVSVVPLVDAWTGDAHDERMVRAAEEREVAILLVGLRGWKGNTAHSDLDSIYAINLYLEVICAAIASAGGRQGPYTGEHLLALFGSGTAPSRARAQALAAAAAIAQRVRAVDERLLREFAFAADIGICLHAGPAAIGEVGPASARTLTAVGDSVRVAHQLFVFSRNSDLRFIASAAALRDVDLEDYGFAWREIEITQGASISVAYISSTEAQAAAMEAKPSSCAAGSDNPASGST